MNRLRTLLLKNIAGIKSYDLTSFNFRFAVFGVIYGKERWSVRQDWRSSWSWVLLPPPPPSNQRGCGWRPAKNPLRNSSSNNTTYSIGQNPNSKTSLKNLKSQTPKFSKIKISERRNSRKSALPTRQFAFLKKIFYCGIGSYDGFGILTRNCKNW